MQAKSKVLPGLILGVGMGGVVGEYSGRNKKGKKVGTFLCEHREPLLILWLQNSSEVTFCQHTWASWREVYLLKA